MALDYRNELKYVVSTAQIACCLLYTSTQTMVGPDNLVQVVSWYDNENSYVSQMVRTIKYFAELG